MSKLLKLSQEVILNRSKSENSDILPGLRKKEFGFIIASPSSGKGYLCLSIAYEFCSNSRFIGLKGNSKPIKVLYWPAEDTVETTTERMKSHLEGFDPKITEEIFTNLTIWDSTEHIACSEKYLNSGTFIAATKARQELIDAAEDFDLLIIDTLRESMGTCKEVDDDLEIKLTLQQIARKANVAILVTHHPTKEMTKGNEDLTSIVGSGLSMTQSNSRYSLYLEKKIDKKGKKPNQFILSHAKDNNVPTGQVLKNEELIWDNFNFLKSKSNKLKKQSLLRDNFVSSNEQLLVDDYVISDKEPKTLDLDQCHIEPSDNKKSNVLNKDEKQQYETFLSKQKNNSKN